MNQPVGVKVLEEIDDLGDVEHLNFLGELGDVETDELGELSSLAELEDEVEHFFVLESVTKLHHSRMLDRRQQLLLHHRLVLLPLLLQLPLLYLFHGVDSPIGIFDDQKDVPVGPLPQLVLHCEVLDCQAGGG